MMSRIFLLLLIGVSMLAVQPALCATPAARADLTQEGVAELPAALTDKLDGYLSGRQAQPLGWSPKGDLLILTRFGDFDELHLVEHAGGARRQLTFLREPISQAAFSPDPGRAAYFYLSDTGGGEHTQLYYQRVGEQGARLLSDGKSRNGAPLWSNSGHEIAFFTNARNGIDYDIDVVAVDGGALPHLALTGDGGAWYPLDWSSDDRKLLVLKSVSSAENYLYIVDLGTGQRREVEPSGGKVRILDAKFSRDGQGVYLISDADSEYTRVRLVNLFTAQKTVVSAATPWDVEHLALSRDGHYLAYDSNEGGISKLGVLDLRTHQDLIPPRMPVGGVIDELHFDADGKRLAFGFSAPTQPRDAYVLDMAGNRLEAWTSSELGSVDAAKLVVPRLTLVPTFDRADGKSRQLPVYVYEPAAPGPHPVLIVLHGGPESQFRPEFDAWLQFVVNELGFAVLAPNVRGSSGYGKTYMSLDNGVLREDAVKDVGALLVWLRLQSSFDAKRVVVSGASYGGYLALATLATFPDRLRAGVDFGGMTDFLSFLANTAPYRQNQRRAEYGDERDADMRAYLRRISPLTNAERITRPVLIVHGRNDPRVPISESEQLVNRLRSHGRTVWYLEAAGEGHGFARKHDRDAYYRAFAAFLTSASSN